MIQQASAEPQASLRTMQELSNYIELSGTRRPRTSVLPLKEAQTRIDWTLSFTVSLSRQRPQACSRPEEKHNAEVRVGEVTFDSADEPLGGPGSIRQKMTYSCSIEAYR